MSAKRSNAGGSAAAAAAVPAPDRLSVSNVRLILDETRALVDSAMDDRVQTEAAALTTGSSANAQSGAGTSAGGGSAAAAASSSPLAPVPVPGSPVAVRKPKVRFVRATSNIRDGELLMSELERRRNRRWGIVAGQNAGKSTILRSYLLPVPGATPCGAYSSCDPRSAVTLQGSESEGVDRTFPMILRADESTSVTPRTIIYRYANRVRVTRRFLSLTRFRAMVEFARQYDAMRRNAGGAVTLEQVDGAIDAIKQEAEPEMDKRKEDGEGGTNAPAAAAAAAAPLSSKKRFHAVTSQFAAVLFDGSTAPVTNLWDDVRSMAVAIATAESEADAHPDLSLACCAVVVEGPWAHLGPLEECYDLPGLTDPDVKRVKMAQLVALELDVAVVLSHNRVVSPHDIQLMEFLLNRPLRDVPHVFALYNHGKVSPLDWQANVKHGLSSWFGRVDPITRMSPRSTLETALRGVLCDPTQCPRLTGIHRNHVFEMLLQDDMPRTILYYTRAQWAELERIVGPAALQQELEREPKMAGFAALHSHLNSAFRKGEREKLLEVSHRIHNAIMNSLALFTSRRRFVRMPSFQPNTAAKLLDHIQQTLLPNSKANAWREDVGSIEPWLQDDRAQWRQSIAHFMHQQCLAPGAAADGAAAGGRPIIHAAALKKSVEQLLSLSLPPRQSWALKQGLVRQLLSVILDGRLRTSFSHVYLSLHLVLSGSGPDDKRSAKDLQALLACQNDELTELMQMCVDMAAPPGEGADSDDADTVAVAGSFGAAGRGGAWSGHGSLGAEAQQEAKRMLLPAIYQGMRNETDACLQAATTSVWFVDAVCNCIRNAWKKLDMNAIVAQAELSVAASSQQQQQRANSPASGAGAASSSAAVPHSGPAVSLPRALADGVERGVRSVFRTGVQNAGNKRCPKASTDPEGAVSWTKATRDAVVNGDRLKDEAKQTLRAALQLEDGAEAARDRFIKLKQKLERLTSGKAGEVAAALAAESPSGAAAGGAASAGGPAAGIPPGTIVTSTMSEANFLEEPANCVNSKMLPPGALGRIAVLPDMPSAEKLQHLSGNFKDVPLAPIRLLSSLPSEASPFNHASFPPSSTMPIANIANSFLPVFRTQPLYTSHPKRVLLDFKGGDPASGAMQIFAYDDLMADLRKCLLVVRHARGIAPIFISTLGRAERNKKPAAQIHLDGERGLEVDTHPHALVFVLIEMQEAALYFEKHGQQAHPHPKLSTVFVVIPGKHRGIRFSRACAVYFAQCLNEAIRQPQSTEAAPGVGAAAAAAAGAGSSSIIGSSVSSSVSLDLITMLDDDWHSPRYCDPRRLGEQHMRPCTLYMTIYYQQKVLLQELQQQDQQGRFNVLADADGDSLKVAMPDFDQFLDDVGRKIGAESHKKSVKFTNMVHDKQQLPSILADADRGLLYPPLADLTHSIPEFKDEFFRFLQQLRIRSNSVCQVACTSYDITRLHDYNNFAACNQAMATLTEPDNKQQTGATDAGAGAGASAPSAAHVPGSAAGVVVGGHAAAASVQTLESSSDALLSGAHTSFTYRVSSSLVGCVSHALSAYSIRHVNYMSSAEFFLPQRQIDSMLGHLEANWRYFTDDGSFLRDTLRAWGLGSFIIFKVDLNFFPQSGGGGITFFQNKLNGQVPRKQRATKSKGKAGKVAPAAAAAAAGAQVGAGAGAAASASSSAAVPRGRARAPATAGSKRRRSTSAVAAAAVHERDGSPQLVKAEAAPTKPRNNGAAAAKRPCRAKQRQIPVSESESESESESDSDSDSDSESDSGTESDPSIASDSDLDSDSSDSSAGNSDEHGDRHDDDHSQPGDTVVSMDVESD